MVKARLKIAGWSLAPDKPPHGGERPSLRIGRLILSDDVELAATSLLAI